MRLWMELHPSLDVDRWRRQHAEGIVPDRLPYGLDRLAHYGVRVDPRKPSVGLTDVLGGRIARRVGGGYTWVDAFAVRMPRDADVALSWD